MAQSYPSAPPLPTSTPTNLVTKVQLSISCRNLLDKDLLSKSDPLVVVYLFTGSQWTEIGRTEQIKDTLNPDFAKSITLDYHFEELQKLKISVFDIDDIKADIRKSDFLGDIECTLGQLVSSQKYTKSLRFPGKTNAGTIVITAEELSSNQDLVELIFRAQHLDKKDLFGKADPYLEFSRANEDGSFVVVHRTEVVKNTLKPLWRPFQVKVVNLCNADFKRIIKVDCYDWNSDGSRDFIGQFSTDLDEMKNAKQWNEAQRSKSKS